ncbi:energy-coupling factor ABC transporter ATP-binding protein [Gracilibacillus thailandensis]|uniref:Energy-coupling factor transporter ATP-binding protein EcfA2 n=1 Tax=Gracilibacillus thailandensis TaxID=563735 RepID=A0A6N7R1B6_9BACI|nr:energy-coupling factor ABC transporter ATP-binding protein [Gracilibacillus thailandensis]MRI67001.1 energy-coupling factor ABC transporter ATP-binding protein [Gracilibacillus thailandensis]
MDIQFERVSYTYQMNTPFSYQALKDINMEIKTGEFVAVVGHTGSGKSTLLQHINGLLLPTEGQVQVGEFQLSRDNKRQDLKKLREKVGVVFQYPEHQLFEETVERDISFGLKNFQVPAEETQTRIASALEKVHLSDDVLQKSPFELSGGQMRRVAIAGVLAMDPEVLILDEPTAGLDPKGQHDVMNMFYDLHKTKHMTTILVTHQMNHALEYADHIFVLADGRVHMEGAPEQIFSRVESLEEANLDMPDILSLMNQINQKFGTDLCYKRQKPDELAKEIVEQLRENKPL